MHESAAATVPGTVLTFARLAGAVNALSSAIAGFALLAGTGANLAGLGGPTAAVVGAVTPLHLPGLVTGLMPLVGAAALGFLGRT